MSTNGEPKPPSLVDLAIKERPELNEGYNRADLANLLSAYLEQLVLNAKVRTIENTE